MSWRRVSKAMRLAIDKVVTASKLGSHDRGVYVALPWILLRPRLCWPSGDCAAGSVPAWSACSAGSPTSSNVTLVASQTSLAKRSA